MLIRQKKLIVFVPEILWNSDYEGPLDGIYNEQSGTFNIVMKKTEEERLERCQFLGEIFHEDYNYSPETYKYLCGIRTLEGIDFYYDGVKYKAKIYNLIQNIFSRNTGILESDIMASKCAIILGCGSVGSLVALELARAGIGKFVLVDNDIVEYHNLCRHQCGVLDVGSYKVTSVAKRIRDINPMVEIEECISIVERVRKQIFDTYCQSENTVIIGCADNREADVYANGLAVLYRVPFVSIGFWERAFAGEIFYYLPEKDMPCYECALGDGGGVSKRTSTSRRIYTNEQDLSKVYFEPGISVDINFVTIVGVKIILDIINRQIIGFTPRLLDYLKQYTLICNTNKAVIGGEMTEIFSYPLQVTTSLVVNYCKGCPPCKYEK
ncbi:MAG: HesA/MoeB/ThiF family protein [Candidatus Humimicrobiaceae bacterium]